MKPKLYTNAHRAVENIFDGATITISGYCGVGLPLDLVQAIIQKKVKNLTVITLAIGMVSMLIEHGCVKKIITCMPRIKFGRLDMKNEKLATNLLEAQNELEIELVNQVTLIERLKAGASDVTAFYTTVGADTELANGKETRMINGKKHVLEYGIKPDFAICRVDTADTQGNVCYNQFFKNITHEIIMAGRTTIVQADNIKDPGSFDPDLSGCFVNKLIKTKKITPPFRVPNLLENNANCNNIGKRVAMDLPAGSLVEVGIGIPWYAVNYVDHSKDVTLHIEGAYGVKSVVPDTIPDTHFRGPTSEVVDLIPGGHTMSFTDSFNVIMRGLVDVALMGTFQVDAHGTFANWKVPNSNRPATVGASMELATHAKEVWVMMEHFDSEGRCKIVEECTYPITARNVVKRIYTELCTLAVTDNGLQVLDIVGNTTHEELERLSSLKLIPKEIS